MNLHLLPHARLLLAGLFLTVSVHGAGHTNDFNVSTYPSNLGTAQTTYKIGLYKENALTISGAGTALVNGVYHRNDGDPSNSRAQFTSDTGGLRVAWFADSSEWLIYSPKTSTVYYKSSNNVTTPNLVTTWTAISGQTPLPTVTATTPTTESVRVSCEKGSTSWDGFTYELPNSDFDMSANPFVSLRMKSDRDMNFRIYLWDTGSAYNDPNTPTLLITRDGAWVEYCWDFRNVTVVNKAHVKHLLINVNPGEGKDHVFYMDDLRVGDSARRMPNMTPINNQQTYVGGGQRTITFRNVTTTTNSLTAVSSNPTLVPNPVISYTSGQTTGTISYTPSANTAGQAVITVTQTSSDAALNTARVYTFTIDVEANQAPTIDAVSNQSAAAGRTQSVILTGIDDGNSNWAQTVSITAQSNNSALLPNPSVEYIPGSPTARLSMTPAAGQSGTATVTVTVSDNGGTSAGGVNSATTSFLVTVYPSINRLPTMNSLYDVEVMNGSGAHQVALTGIDDGDPNVSQTIAITAVSGDPAVVAHPTVQYSGGTTATLTIQAPTLAYGTTTTTITVTLTDNGGNANNNGHASHAYTFDVLGRPPPSYGWTDDFNDGVVDPNWNGLSPGGNPAGEGGHVVSETTESGNGVLKFAVAKAGVWNGQWYKIPNELDISAHPYVTAWVKSTAAKNMRVFLWDAYGHYNSEFTVQTVMSNTGYTKLVFDFTDKQADTVFERITYLLFNFAPGELWTGSVYFDSIGVGSGAEFTPTYTVKMDAIGNRQLAQGSGSVVVKLSGLSNGQGDKNNVNLSASTNNSSVVTGWSFGPVSNGEANLTLNLGAGTGNASVTVTATAAGATQIQRSFTVQLLSVASPTVTVNLNKAVTYQTMDGIGVFVGVETRYTPDLIADAQRLGITLVRLGLIGTELEPWDDNSDPAITNYENLDTDAFHWETYRELYKQAGVKNFVLCTWSPPAWMKRNKSLAGQTADNILEPFNYIEYGEMLIAFCNIFRREVGVELMAVSLQNEPQFNEPYGSCQVTPQNFADIIEVVGPMFASAGLKTKLMWGEALEAQGQLQNYHNVVVQDAQARPYAHYYSIHYSPADAFWTTLYNMVNSTSNGGPRKMYMTENSGEANGGVWSAGLECANRIYRSLRTGHCSGWIYWGFRDVIGSETYSLMNGGIPNSKGWAQACFGRFIKPGAVNIDSSVTGDANVLAVAFNDESNGAFTVVLINNNASTTPRTFRLTGSNLPASFDLHSASDNVRCERLGSYVTGQTGILPGSSVTTLVANLPVTIPTVKLQTQPGQIDLRVPGSKPGLVYTLMVSDDLQIWTEAPQPSVNGDGSEKVFNVARPSAGTVFYRIDIR